MNYICEQESIYYALILLSLICCIHSATIIHRFSRECEKGMINTGKKQLQESIKMCKKHKKILKKSYKFSAYAHTQCTFKKLH
jgi:hypothetical protein